MIFLWFSFSFCAALEYHNLNTSTATRSYWVITGKLLISTHRCTEQGGCWVISINRSLHWSDKTAVSRIPAAMQFSRMDFYSLNYSSLLSATNPPSPNSLYSTSAALAFPLLGRKTYWCIIHSFLTGSQGEITSHHISREWMMAVCLCEVCPLVHLAYCLLSEMLSWQRLIRHL